MKIEWHELEPHEIVDAFNEIDEYCQCSYSQTKFTLCIEEGQAHLSCVECALPPYMEPEDIFIDDVPVTIEVETCSDPGGWHGLERCDCGPVYHIELDSTD